jgi:Dolichyl-phosphate-mannose-protein mannosyltransferase
MSRTAVVAILGLLMATGAFLRLHNLGARTFGHNEAYVPNVPLATEVSQPPERLTLLKTLTGSIWEVHPPAWYLAMWPWTKLFGTSLVAIRLPQALLGIVSVLLIYLMVREETDAPTGLLAAALLAVNGHHILWSQIARPYMATSFLGLLSTVLLLRATRPLERPRWLLPAYAVVTVCGLSTTYYYWPLCAAQIAWTLMSGLGGRRLMTGVLRTQMASVIVSTPMISLAVFQAQSSYLRDFESSFFGDFVGFAFLFEGDPLAQLPLTVAARASYVAGAVVFLALGAFSLLRTTRPASDTDRAPVSLRHLALVSALAVMGVLAAALALHSKRPARTPLILATTLAPLSALAFTMAVEFWAAPFASRSPADAPSARPQRQVSLFLLLALVPTTLISVVALRIPFFASRHMMSITPYLLAVIATGISTLIGWIPRPARLPVVAVLAIWLATAHVAGYAYQARRPMSNEDFAGLARQWVPRIGPGDVIVVRPRRWRISPMFYYLQTARNRIIGSDYEAAIRDHPGSVVWLLSTTSGRSLSDDVGGSLKGYSEAEDIEVRGLLVRRFVPVDRAR